MFGPTADAAAQTRLSLVDYEYTTIGTTDGPAHTTFAGIVGAVLLPDGTLAIADGGNQVIRFFGGDGSYVRSVGRDGEGPGEFRALRWLGRCPDGSLLAGDPRLGRATRVTSEGAVVGIVPLPPAFGFVALLACEGPGSILVHMNRPRTVGPPDAVSRAPSSSVRIDLEHGTPETLHSGGGTDYYFSSRAGAFMPVPLGARAHAAASSRWLYSGQSDSSIIDVVELRTGRQRSFAHGLQSREVDADMWEAAKAMLVADLPLASTRRVAEAVLADAPRPDHAPFYVRMISDRGGRLWLKLPPTDSAAEWWVYGPDGQVLAVVELDADVDILDVGERHIIGLARDALDVQFIRTYALPDPLIVRPANR